LRGIILNEQDNIKLMLSNKTLDEQISILLVDIPEEERGHFALSIER
jgi:hypothetical protein